MVVFILHLAIINVLDHTLILFYMYINLSSDVLSQE